jgi:phosphatidylserine/phosphatidylglycerophosphate/cardiolipin synthase-like enzyme
MSTRIFGRLITDNSSGNVPLVGFKVSVYWGRLLKSDWSKAGGVVDFDYMRDTSNIGDHRTLKIVVQDQVGRVVASESKEDTDADELHLDDFIIKEADAKGFLVTLGTGETGPATGDGWGLAEGASVKFLIDNEAFQKAAQLFLGARDLIYFSQLFFPVPDVFHADATQENTNLIFDFHAPVPDADHLRAAGVGDERPERLLLEAADRDVDVRILLNSFEVPLFIKILAGVLIFPFAGTDGISALENLLSNVANDVEEDTQYFSLSGRPGVKVRAFRQSLLSAGVMHAKLMIVDAACALSIGSPFDQSYIDSHGHAIDAPVRGDSHDFPRHDAGFIAKGPVIRTMYNTLKLLWDNAAPDDKLQDYPPTPPDSHHGASVLPDDWDTTCSVQIVRTLSARKFDDQPKGEKGILEAYLRAFNMAKDFIYLENQYFTNNAIGDALVEAMKAKPDLHTIMLLNIRPDTPFYPWKQRRLIHCIRKGLKDAPNGGAARFGVFTRWSHQTGSPRPQLLPVYIHAKVGIVDDTWCTVGSANLDGLSLDSFLLNPFVEQRAIELNAIMLNGVEGAPASDAPDLLRRKLWAEHLGYRDSSGALDITAADLRHRPTEGWHQLWINHAKGTLSQLINDPRQPLIGAQILPWPEDNTTHKTPRDYLQTLGIQSYAVVPLKGTRAFDFKKGEWKNKAAMDYD